MGYVHSHCEHAQPWPSRFVIQVSDRSTSPLPANRGHSPHYGTRRLGQMAFLTRAVIRSQWPAIHCREPPPRACLQLYPGLFPSPLSALCGCRRLGSHPAGTCLRLRTFFRISHHLSEQSRASCQCQRYLDSRRISQQRILETTRRSRVSAIAVPSTNMAM